jgi:hypothetical protein
MVAFATSIRGRRAPPRALRCATARRRRHFNGVFSQVSRRSRLSSSMVEQWTFNPLVQGSSPWGGTADESASFVRPAIAERCEKSSVEYPPAGSWPLGCCGACRRGHVEIVEVFAILARHRRNCHANHSPKERGGQQEHRRHRKPVFSPRGRCDRRCTAARTNRSWLRDTDASANSSAPGWRPSSSRNWRRWRMLSARWRSLRSRWPSSSSRSNTWCSATG